jgi:hypothetical protein
VHSAPPYSVDNQDVRCGAAAATYSRAHFYLFAVWSVLTPPPPNVPLLVSYAAIALLSTSHWEQPELQNGDAIDPRFPPRSDLHVATTPQQAGIDRLRSPSSLAYALCSYPCSWLVVIGLCCLLRGYWTCAQAYGLPE